jgi:hypothetical protein
MFYCGGDDKSNISHVTERLISLIISLPYELNDNINLIGLLDYSDHEYLLKLERSSGKWSKLKKLPLDPITHSSDEINMGSEETFESFINYCYENYPAKRYFLEFIGHGHAYDGVIFDSDTGNEGQTDCLSLVEIENAFIGLDRKLDIFLLGSCLMGNLEMIYELRFITDYFIVSEGITLPAGVLWNILNVFNTNYESDSLLIAEEIINGLSKNAPSVNSLINIIYLILSGSKPADNFKLTWSAISTSKIEDVVQEIDDLSIYLKEIDNFPDLEQAVNDTDKEVQRFYGFYTDIYDFCKILKDKTTNSNLKDKCENVMHSLDNVIVSNYHQKGVKANGLTIVFPFYCDLAYFTEANHARWADEYYRNVSTYDDPFKLSFPAVTQWDEFLIECGRDE